MKINKDVIVDNSTVSLENLATKLTNETPVILYDNDFNLPTGGNPYGSVNIHLSDNPENYDYLVAVIYESGYTSACIIPGGSWGKTTTKRARIMTRYFNQYFQMSPADANNNVTAWFEGDTPVPDGLLVILHIYGIKTYGQHLY